jgi:hypothetical protein
MDNKMKKIEFFEPWFFIFFGLFHLHRIWGLVDRNSYADFWIRIMEEKGIFYYSLMGILAILCIWGIITFFKNVHHNYWWRWIYLLGGSYVLFDLFAVAIGLKFWHEILLKMFDVSASYWDILWFGFILLGAIVMALGMMLFVRRKKQLKN